MSSGARTSCIVTTSGARVASHSFIPLRVAALRPLTFTEAIVNIATIVALPLRLAGPSQRSGSLVRAVNPFGTVRK